MSQELHRYLSDLGFAPHERPRPEDVKKRWKDLCTKHHPDRGGDQAEFIKVTHAYHMLTDPEYRHKEKLRAMREGRGGVGGDLNIRVHIPISFEDAFFGKRMVVTFTPLRFGPGLKLDVAGPEYRADLVTEAIEIPPGSLDGIEILKEGLGHSCGDERGSVVYHILPQPHPIFSREGMDIVSKEQVPLKTMLCGGVISVATMLGLKPLKVPAGTRPDDRLKIKNCGVPGGGNHIVVVEPLYPSADELKGDDKWKALGISWDDDKAARDEQAEAFQTIFIRLGGFKIGS